MANPEHLVILEQGVEAWNEWRKKNPYVKPDFAGEDFRRPHLRRANLRRVNFHEANLHEAKLELADLRGADLINADLHGANLIGADLRGADLSWANLIRADLGSADLRDANLGMAHLREVMLREAILIGAELSWADFIKADLRGADFSGVSLYRTVFGDVDLSEVKGLEGIVHSGPSIVGIDTIYKSKGKIPEVFLRGCGVPENMITFMHSLVGMAIEFSSCFLSYSGKDQDFAERLHADLQSKAVRVWFAPEDLKIGDRLRDTIEEAIRIYDKLMVVLSDHSINSGWVRREVKTALEKEKQQNCTVLFPIRLDDAVMDSTEQWADDIRRDRHIGDFRNWKDPYSYQKAFTRLLRDLQSDPQKPST